MHDDEQSFVGDTSDEDIYDDDSSSDESDVLSDERESESDDVSDLPNDRAGDGGSGGWLPVAAGDTGPPPLQFTATPGPKHAPAARAEPTE